MKKKGILRPQGKKIYKVEDLDNLPLNEDGELQVPEGGILMGPDGKWWIDEEGNAYFGGEMTVCKDVDPQYCQLDSQGSAAGAPNRSLVVVSEALQYKDNTGTASDVPLGTVTGDHPTAVTSITNHVDPGTLLSSSFGTDIEQVSITPSSTDADIFVMAMFACYDGGGDIAGVRITRGTSTALATWSAATTSSTVNSHWGGMLAAVDSPATTSATTYELQFDGDGSERAIHTSLVAWECIQGDA